MDASKLADPGLWAQSGGLIGLIIFALFFALALFLWTQSKIYSMHRDDIKILLKEHAEERKGWNLVVDSRQRETNEAIMAIVTAVNELSSRSRRYDRDDGK